MDYDEIMKQAEIVNWIFIIGTGIFSILIMAAVEVTFYMNKESDEYLLIYENNQETKLAEFTEDLPRLMKIYVKRLYEAFDITSRDIESTIK